MIRNPAHTLTFGSLTLVEEGAHVPDANGVQYLVMAQDTTFGNPVPVTRALLTLMSVGSAETWERTDNREPVLRVTIKAFDLDQLALGEKALQAECEKPNTLSWTPPDGAGLTSVFDIVWSSLELVTDDLAELRRERTYLIRLRALPHAREAANVVTPATAITPTYGVIDNGSSTTGWSVWGGSGSGAATISSVSGSIRLTDSGDPSTFRTAQRTASLDLTGVRYLALDVSATVPWTAVYVHLKATASAYLTPLQATARTDLGGGVSRLFFPVPGVGLTEYIRVVVYGTWSVGTYFAIDQIQTATAIPYIGTARQRVLSLIPGGSVKTAGSIQVSHATNSLGKVIVYTHPSGTGYLPTLSPWWSSGGARGADAAMLSGAKATMALGTDQKFNVPVAALPTGRCEIWAWLNYSTTNSFVIRWGVGSYMGTTLLGSGWSGGYRTVALPTANTWTLVQIAVATTPPVDIGPSGYVQVAFAKDSGGDTLQYDEAYLFATTEGRLTVVDCDTGAAAVGGPSNRLWIDAPTAEKPYVGVYRGNAANRSDSWHASTQTAVSQVHTFDPGGTSVFVATQGTIDAETSLTHYRRYHTHVSSE